MSDMGDDFKALKEHRRERRDAVLPSRQQAIRDLVLDGFTVEARDDGRAYRINNVLDLFPVHQRFHYLTTNVRGGYSNPRDCVARFIGKPFVARI